MPSGQSLWIDEGFTVPYASTQSISEFVSRLTQEEGSEALMPLGMLSTWVGAKVFGQSERGLRLVSTFWAAVAVILMWRVGELYEMPWLALVFACHPFLWYYGGEARPYAMVIALGAGVLYALAAEMTSDSHGSKGLTALLIFGPLLFATHILGILPFVASATVFVVVRAAGTGRFVRREWSGISLSAAMVTVIGAYYLWALARGAETASENPWTVNIGSFLFSGYELFGFVGFGPGRYELRQLAMHGGLGEVVGGMARPSLIGAVSLVVLYGYLVVGLFKRLHQKRPFPGRVLVLTGFVAVVTLLGTVVLFFTAGTPFWGRHLASILPFLLFLVVVTAGVAMKPRVGPINLVTAILIVVLLTSSLMVRFTPDHSRDDYRAASQLAVEAVSYGQSVWWAAAPKAATYYGVPFCDRQDTREVDCVVFVENAETAWLAALAEPDVVIISKPDLYDSSAIVQRYVDSRGFELDQEFMAFRVFRPVEDR